MNKCSLINLSKLPTCVHIRELNALVCPDVMCFTEQCLVDRNKKNARSILLPLPFQHRNSKSKTCVHFYW